MANPKKRLSPGEEAEIASSQWDRYVRARDNGHLDYIENAKRCDAFYRGDQVSLSRARSSVRMWVLCCGWVGGGMVKSARLHVRGCCTRRG